LHEHLLHMGANREGFTNALRPFLTPPEIQGALSRMDEILRAVDSGEVRVADP